ncbi:MAG: aldo/keto reductase, partial [Mycetocola sp.]
MSGHGARISVAGRELNRLGFGAARLTAGDGWGDPSDREPSRQVLRDVIAAGIDYIDTADALGPGVSESIIGEVVGASGDACVATKAGMIHSGEREWGVFGRPDYLRQQAHASRARLGVHTIDLFYLHRVDPAFPLADQWNALRRLRDEGVVRAIGVSEPSAQQLEQIVAIEPPAAVQSHYNLIQRGNDPIVARTAELGIPFVAYWPLAGNAIAPDLRAAAWQAIAPIAAEHGL